MSGYTADRTKGLYEDIEAGEWSFLEVPECVKAIELGARRAFAEVSTPGVDTVEDFIQNAYLYAATHPATIASINTGVMLSRHIATRLIRDGRARWEREGRTESYEAMLEDREDGL